MQLPGVSAGMVQAHLVAEPAGWPQADPARRGGSGLDGEVLANALSSGVLSAQGFRGAKTEEFWVP